MLFCGLVAWKCHVCFFLCKDVTNKKTKKEKKCPCVIYISIHTQTFIHTRTCAHTLSCRPHSLLCYCAWEPLSVKASTATATARQRAQTHTHTHFKNTHTSHALIFLAIVQQFYSSKPYHKSLHSCSISLYQYLAHTHKHRRQASAWIVLIVFPRSVPLLSSPQKMISK